MRRAAKVDANQPDLSRRYGAANPNFKNAGWKICKTCGKEYHSYNKSRKYCSRRCYGLSPENIEKANSALEFAHENFVPRPSIGRRCKCKYCGIEFRSKQRRIYCDDHIAESNAARGGKGGRREKKARIISICLQCGKKFEHYKSKNRKYCCYQCHLNSGGAVRAGKAAGTMTRKYGAKKDANHSEIVNALKSLGACVIDLSALGSGIPDLIVWCRNGWHLVDVKNPKTGYGKRGLNQRQKEWANQWKGGPVYLISTVEQAADLINGKFDDLKSSNRL